MLARAFAMAFVKNKPISAFLRQFLRRKLPAGVVNGVGRVEDELGDGEDGVAVVDEVGEDSGQRLRRVEGGVVEQHDAARLYLGGHPLADGVRVVILPVEGVPAGNDLKPLCRKGLRVWRLCASAENLTCKRGVWGCFRRGRGQNRGGVRGGRWLKDGGGYGILKIG